MTQSPYAIIKLSNKGHIMKISRHRDKANDLYNKIGIFSTSLFVASLVTYTFLPAIGVYAETANSRVNLNITPVISLSVDASNVVFDIAPTHDGVFKSKPVTATVETNSVGGYELYFSSINNETDMTSESSSNVISSDFTGTVTSTTMASNKWGYSLDNTDFAKIPTLNDHALIRNLDHMPTSNELSTTIHFGVKVNSSLLSGSYNKSVLFTTIASDSSQPIVATSYMQDMTPALCNSYTLNDPVYLTDIRDGNVYTVKKLADGNCWMTENLRISNTTITSEDSNLPEGASFVIPNNSPSDFGVLLDTSRAYIEPTYGGFYNFYTATAGWGVSDVTGGSSPKDICPKGWRLPTGNDNGDLQTLLSYYNSSAQLRADPSFDLSGLIYERSYIIRGEGAAYWSSSLNADNEILVNTIMLNSTEAEIDGVNFWFGLPIRCIAK